MRNQLVAGLTLLCGASAVVVGWFLGLSSRPDAEGLNVLKKTCRDIAVQVHGQQASIRDLAAEVRALHQALAERSSVMGPAEAEQAADELETARAGLSDQRKREFLRSIYLADDEYSDVWISNRLLQSSDQYLKAYALRMILESAEDVSPMLAHVRHGMDATTVTAAEVLASRATVEIEEELHTVYGRSQFPRGFGAAVALAEIGDDSCLQEWGTMALDRFPALTPVQQRELLNACTVYAVPYRGMLALRASESQDSAVRREAVTLLARLGTEEASTALTALTEDPEPGVAAKARLTLMELQIQQK